MSTNRAELKKAPILRRLNLPPPRFCLHCGEYDTMVEIDNQLAGMKTVVSIHGAARVGVPVHACALCNFANVPAVMDYTGATITSNRGVVELARGWGWHAAATGGGQFVCGSPIEPDVLVCSNLCKLGTSLLMKGLSSCVWRARNWGVWCDHISRAAALFGRALAESEVNSGRIDIDALRTTGQQLYRASASARGAASQMATPGLACPACTRRAGGVTSDCDCKFFQQLHTALALNKADADAGVRPCMEVFGSLSLVMNNEKQTAFQEMMAGIIGDVPPDTCDGRVWVANGSAVAAAGAAESVGAMRCSHGFVLAAVICHKPENNGVHLSLLDDIHCRGGRVLIPTLDFGCMFKKVLLGHMDELLASPLLNEGTKQWLRDLKAGVVDIRVGSFHIPAHVWACLSV